MNWFDRNLDALIFWTGWPGWVITGLILTLIGLIGEALA